MDTKLTLYLLQMYLQKNIKFFAGHFVFKNFTKDKLNLIYTKIGSI